MSWHRKLRNLVHRDRLSREIAVELAFHIAERVDELVESGLSLEEAQRLALRQFGNFSLNTERTQDMDVIGWLESVGKDLRYAVRALRQNPAFTAIAVLTLALGIGANASLFSVVSALFLKPPPYVAPERLVTVWETSVKEPDDTNIVSAPNFADWRQRNHVFSDMAIYEDQSFNAITGNGAVAVAGARVSADLFPLLGVSAALGRTPAKDEEPLGRDRVVVLGHGFWQEHFGGDPAVLGKRIRLNGEAYSVIGVMPAGFYFPSPGSAVWVPIGLNDTDKDRGAHSFRSIARLKPGVTLAQASNEMDVIGKRLSSEYPIENHDETVALIPLDKSETAELRPVFAALLGAVSFVLLIAAANLANLLLARGAARERELALRSALGAGKWRIVRQLLTESVLLASLGCVAGLLLARCSMAGITRMLPGNVKWAPFRDMETLVIDGRVLLFAVAVSLIAGLIFGLAPALQAFRADPIHAQKQGGRGSISGGSRLRHILIAGEVALALVVLTGAGLLTRSVALLLGVDPGLNPKNVLTVRVALPQADFYGPPQRVHFCQQLRESAERIPGVIAAGAVSNLPFTGSDAGRGFNIEGRPNPTVPGEGPGGSYSIACPGYFRTLGIPLMQGREFEDRDSVPAPQVAIINESSAKKYWPGENPVGRRIKLGRPNDPSPWITVVGVVRDTRRWGFDIKPRPELFRPYSQAAWPGMSLVVRTAANSPASANAVRTGIAAMDKELPVSNVSTMESVLDESVGPRRFPLLVLGSFSLLALILAAVGIYGVVSYLVAQRTQEIGLRLALGARKGQVLRLVFGRSLPPIAIGLATGLAASLMLGRLLDSLLYGVRPADPLVLGLVTSLLATIAILAIAVPARRATAIDPAIALRQE